MTEDNKFPITNNLFNLKLLYDNERNEFILSDDPGYVDSPLYYERFSREKLKAFAKELLELAKVDSPPIGDWVDFLDDEG